MRLGNGKAESRQNGQSTEYKQTFGVTSIRHSISKHLSEMTFKSVPKHSRTRAHAYNVKIWRKKIQSMCVGSKCIWIDRETHTPLYSQSENVWRQCISDMRKKQKQIYFTPHTHTVVNIRLAVVACDGSLSRNFCFVSLLTP